MRRLVLLALLALSACAEPFAVREVSTRCTLYQLPDGTVYDACH